MAPYSTSATLLIRVRDPHDVQAWREFDARYGELILRYCLRRGLRHSDAEDVRQLVLIRLAQALPRFEYRREHGRFRNFVGRVARNEVARFLARPGLALDRVLDMESDATVAGDAAQPDPPWEREWMLHHLRLALRTVRERFDACSVEVFERLLAGGSTREVSGAFGLSEQAVHKIKQRIRDRLHELVVSQIAAENTACASHVEPSGPDR